jgi:hypothetical protein
MSDITFDILDRIAKRTIDNPWYIEWSVPNASNSPNGDDVDLRLYYKKQDVTCIWFYLYKQFQKVNYYESGFELLEGVAKEYPDIAKRLAEPMID